MSNFEISNGVLKFFNAKGLIRKKIAEVRSIPVNEISAVESYRDELSITWNGVTNIFFKKNSFECFTDLRDKIRAMMDENQIALQRNSRATSRQNELLAMISGMLSIVDVCFDTLMFLHEKRVNWSLINQLCTGLPQNLSLNMETLPPLSLDLSRLNRATKIELPEEVTKEAYALLRIIREYFCSLKPAIENEIVVDHLDVDSSISLIDSYLALNDIFLGKTVGDNNNKEERDFLEGLLTGLSVGMVFKVNIEELKVAIDSFDLENNRTSAVNHSREIFKEKIYQLVAKSSS